MSRRWIVLACAGIALVAVASATGAGSTTSGCSAPAVSGMTAMVTCAYTGAVQTWTAPPGVTFATFTLYGAKGGDAPGLAAGGSGGLVTNSLPVVGGASYDISVGGAGSQQFSFVEIVANGFLFYTNPGGWPNGGNGGDYGGGGGGSTSIASGGTPLLVAGGGGGAGGSASGYGAGGNADANGSDGNGSRPAQGGLSGENGGAGGFGAQDGNSDPTCGLSGGSMGFAGNSSYGGTGGGAFPAVFTANSPAQAGGGGGGGIVGGGQGGGSSYTYDCGQIDSGAGGGGGSSSAGAVPALAPGQNGNGLVVITYTLSRPTSKDQCKGNGWQTFGVFKNQGDCVSYVATGGKNGPNG